MGIHTRPTEALGITVPTLSAPIEFVAGGKLAAAVTAAGGLGIIGGGCGDGDWLDREFAAEGAVAEGGTEESGVFVGEAIGLMQDVSPVSGILACVSKEAEVLLRERATALVK